MVDKEYLTSEIEATLFQLADQLRAEAEARQRVDLIEPIVPPPSTPHRALGDGSRFMYIVEDDGGMSRIARALMLVVASSAFSAAVCM